MFSSEVAASELFLFVDLQVIGEGAGIMRVTMSANSQTLGIMRVTMSEKALLTTTILR